VGGSSPSFSISGALTLLHVPLPPTFCTHAPTPGPGLQRTPPLPVLGVQPVLRSSWFTTLRLPVPPFCLFFHALPAPSTPCTPAFWLVGCHSPIGSYALPRTRAAVFFTLPTATPASPAFWFAQFYLSPCIPSVGLGGCSPRTSATPPYLYTFFTATLPTFTTYGGPRRFILTGPHTRRLRAAHARTFADWFCALLPLLPRRVLACHVLGLSPKARAPHTAFTTTRLRFAFLHTAFILLDRFYHFTAAHVARAPHLPLPPDRYRLLRAPTCRHTFS